MERRPSFVRMLAVFLVQAAVALGVIEAWAARWSWPVADAWYRLEEEGDSIIFGCQQFAPVRFSRAPTPGVRRVLLLGGSTAFGFPERPLGTVPIGSARYGIAGAMQEVLDANWPARFEVVNLGVNGGGSEDTVRLLRRALDWGAEAPVIYDGHNEFMGVPRRFSAPLWRFALYRRLAPLMPKMVEAPGQVGPAAYGDAVHRDAVIAAFRRNLDTAVALGREAGMGVVVATQVANLADFEPSWSTTGSPAALVGLAARSDAEVEALWAGVPGNADVAWEVGRRRLNAGGEAWGPLRAAADADGMPFRASSSVNTTIREVAAARGAVLVDAEEALRIGAGVPGVAEFYDWLHPRTNAAATIASALVDGLSRAGFVPRSAVRSPGSHLSAHDAAGAEKRAAVAWIQWASVRHHDPARRLGFAIRAADAALSLSPGDPEAEALRRFALGLTQGRRDLPADPTLRARLVAIHPRLRD